MSELPKGWVEGELREVCELITDGTHHSPPNGQTGDFKYVTAKNIRRHGLDLTNITFVDRDTHKSIYKRCPVEKGDVLYIKDGATTGLAIVNPLDEEFSMLSSVALIRPVELLNADFLKCQLNSPELFVRMTGDMTGSAIRRLTLTTIGRQKIRIPPLTEQKRIVAKLDALSARSARARKDLERIDALVARYKQAVLSKAFSGELTRDWRQGTLDQVISESLVGLVRSKADQSVSGGTPYIRMNHFDLAGNWNSDNLTTVQLTSSELVLYQLRPNDLLFNTRNSFELVGKVALWDKTAGTHVFNNNILRLRFKSDVIPKFALLQMRSPPFRTYLESVKSATTSVCAIYQKSLMRAPFHFPSTYRQKEIVRRIESAFDKIDRLAGEAKRALALVGRLDEAVLAKAFRGELVPQDPNDEPASVLLERIRAERAAAPKPKRGRKAVQDG